MVGEHIGEGVGDSETGTTFELKITFGAANQRVGALAAATKRKLLAWFKARGISDYVEGVIDGVDLLVEGEDPLSAFEDQTRDATPVSLFSFDESRLQSLMRELTEAFGGEGFSCRLEPFATSAWTSAWDDDYRGISTRRFTVRIQGAELSPPNSLATESGERIVIELSPGTAFGAGDHATTLAALHAFEDLCFAEGVGRHRLLDVGTGTGILAVAAAMSGFSYVLATDIDEDVLAEAARNAALNGAAIGLVNCAVPPLSGAPYDVVVANILVPVLHDLMPHFSELLAENGRLILAGFVSKDVDSLIARAHAHGLEELRSLRRDIRGWIALVLAPRTASPLKSG